MTMTTNVYLDTDTSRELPLQAVAVDPHGWCGFAVPTVTASEFSRFISDWASNDPNGQWVPSGIREGDGALIYDDGEHDHPDVWAVCGIDEHGTALYELSGWTWVL